MAIFSGDIFAENYTVSSSVTNVQISSVSGSTKSGDSSDDIHQFTGSIRLGGNSTGLRVDDGHVRAGRDIMLGSIDESYTDRNTNIQLYYGSGGQAGYIYFLKNGGTGTQYELAANETVFNIKSHRDSQGIGFWTSISGNSPSERLRITGNKISGSSSSTGSFGKVAIGTGDVFTDVSSSAASFLTIDTKAGNYATASAIYIKGSSHINKLRINFDNKSSGTPYSAIEGTTQGGGNGRGELRFYTRNAPGTQLNPRLLIANDGAVALYQAYGAGDPPRSRTFTSASLAVFGSNTNFQKPWAIFAENRSSNAGRGGLFVSAHADNSEEPIIRAANNYGDGTVFEVTANGTQHKVSGSATSTGSFGSVSTRKLDVGGYYVAESGGASVTSGDITLGSKNTGKKVGLELYHSSNPVSFKLHYDSGGGAVTLDNVHQNYIIHRLHQQHDREIGSRV